MTQAQDTTADDTPTILPVTAADGHRFEIRLRETNTADAPMLLFWPAMGTSARYYDPFVAALAAAGIGAAVGEFRGIGSSSLRASRRVNFGYRKLLEQDWPAAVSALRVRYLDARLLIGGHSLGGQLSAMYAAQHPEASAGLVLIASGNIHYRNWHGKRGWKLLFLSQMALIPSAVLGYYPGKRFGFGGTEARSVVRDWARVIRSGRYRARGMAFDFEAAMARLPLPALGITLSGDGLAPPASMLGLLGKFKTTDTTHLHLTETETGRHLNHFNWVKQPAPVVERIATWCQLQNLV